MVNLSSYDVIVFDLDDTLYSEKQYVHSGFKYLALIIQQLFSIDVEDDLLGAFTRNEKDVFSFIIDKYNLPATLKSHLVLAYRYHQPNLTLCKTVKLTLDSLKQLDKPMYLITDGRSLTQRLKINALDIKHYFKKIYISEEVGAEKPSIQSFMDIKKAEINSKIVYIADNPKKDFIAPRQLGWDSIGLKNEKIRVHPLTSDFLIKADVWLESFQEIKI